MKSLSSTPENNQELDSLSEKYPGYPIKIAVVDDDHNELSLMTRAVDQSPDLELAGSYSSGAQALNGIPASTIEVVLMDVRMPGLSGMETTGRLKKVCPGLFIILISGFDSADTALQARKAGADDYLTKPFSLSRFLETLTICLRRRELGVNRIDGPGTFPHSANQYQSGSAEQEQDISPGKPIVHNALVGIINKMEGNFHAREDLLQEAWVHFLLAARQHPGKRLGWYLQSVRYHLQHLKVAGRSLDSPKRRSTRAAVSMNSDEWDQCRYMLELDEGIMSAINARDILALLLERLQPFEQAVLSAFAEGIAVNELAAQLNISHQSVIRARKRIAVIALRLGVIPSLASAISPYLNAFA